VRAALHFGPRGEPVTNTRNIITFGLFEFDVESRELRKQGLKIRLSDQPSQILVLLLERPGEVVTREAVRQRLWPADTFVDFDAGLNSAIKKLRDALRDPAENPQFIETLPRRGYRLIAPVHSTRAAPPDVAADRSTSRLIQRRVVIAVLMTITIAASAVGYYQWRHRTPAPRIVSAQAQDAYLKGILAMGRQTPEGFRHAVTYFEDATEKQPDFAAAHASLAQAQLQLLYTGPFSPREVIPKAEAAVRRALELDDTLVQAHRTLGTILKNYYWKWDEADRAHLRAQQLAASSTDKSNPGGRVNSLIRAGRVDQAIEEVERSSDRDPLSFNAHVNAGTTYRAAGQYERAVARLRRAVEIDPKASRAHFQLGATFVMMGRWNDAITELELATTESRGNARFLAYLAYTYAASGRPADARKILKDLETRRQHHYVSSFGIALIYDALGQVEPALTAIERAYDERAVEFAQMSQYPPFHTIATEPRYTDVMRRIGLPR
jgi:DNA-binding winged helix-turn-helix (wHTH) protein/Flp pilus assembly protein TadD